MIYSSYFFFARLGGLYRWRHVDISSDLRLIIDFSFLKSISTFSSMQRLHNPDDRILVLDFLAMAHFISKFCLRFFSDQIYLESSVSFERFSCRNDIVWLRYLSLNMPPVRPMYDFSESSVVTVASYTIDLTLHMPRRGHSPFFWQLH